MSSSYKEESSSRGELTERSLRLRDQAEESQQKLQIGYINSSNDRDNSPPKSERSHRTSGSAGTSISAMLDVKNSRKRAEADLQLLANRIALLRAEEQKAVTKMLETKSRAQEILLIKKRNEDTMQKKMNNTLTKEMATKSVRDRVIKEREETKKKIAQSKRQVHEGRRIEANETKEEARRYAEDLIMEKQAIEEQKRLKALEEKNRKDAAKRLREKERAEREQQAQMEYARKIAEEAKRTEEAEQLIRQLEKEERDLIDRLKQTQEMQREAYETLQKSLEV